MTTTNFKKGDTVYLVTVGHGSGGGWDPTSEDFRTTVSAELVTLTSYGKRQGTAVTAEGNLKRRIHAGWSRLIRTREEVASFVADLGTGEAANTIARHVEMANDWHHNYGQPGQSGTPLGRERNASVRAALAKCVPLPAKLNFR